METLSHSVASAKVNTHHIGRNNAAAVIGRETQPQPGGKSLLPAILFSGIVCGTSLYLAYKMELWQREQLRQREIKQCVAKTIARQQTIESARKRDRILRQKIQKAVDSFNFLAHNVLLADIITWIQSAGHGERMWLTIGNTGTSKEKLAISTCLAQLLSDEKFSQSYNIHLLYRHSCLSEEESVMQKFVQSLVHSCSSIGLLARGCSSYTSLHDLFYELSIHSSTITYVVMIDDLDAAPSIASFFTYDTLAMVPACLRFVCTSRPVFEIPRAERSLHLRENVLDHSESRDASL